MKKFLALLIALALSLCAVSAFAYDVKVDEDTFATVGFKGQIWYQHLDTAAPGAFPTPPAGISTADANDISIRQIRIYASGQITNLFKFGTNIDFAKGTYDKADTVQTSNAGTSAVTDGFVTLDFMKEAKLMVGIYRMAVSRVALQDSYTFMTVHAPAVAGARYLSNMNNYRDAGVTVWGDLMEGMVRYNVGVWDGAYTPLHTSTSTGSGVRPDSAAATASLVTINPSARPTYTARVAVNLWDPEKGYTNSCCYLGKAKILTIGAGYLDQQYSNATTTLGKTSGDYIVKTVDAYLAMDPITAEVGYFMYDYDTTGAGSKPKAYYAQASFKVDKIEPALRYEHWDSNNGVVLKDYNRYVAGLNYYLDGHNAKISLERLAQQTKDGGALDIDRDHPDHSRTFVDWTLQYEFQF